MYEGGLRVPFMLQWKGHLPAGQISHVPISSLDLFPTASAAAKSPPPENLDGANLLPLLHGREFLRPRHPFFWRQARKAAYRQGDWKAVSHNHNAARPMWQLFNLADDPAEARDLAAEQPDRLSALRSAWEMMNSEMADPMF